MKQTLTSVKAHLVLMVAPAQKRGLVSSVVNVCKGLQAQDVFLLFNLVCLHDVVIMVGKIVLAW